MFNRNISDCWEYNLICFLFRNHCKFLALVGVNGKKKVADFLSATFFLDRKRFGTTLNILFVYLAALSTFSRASLFAISQAV